MVAQGLDLWSDLAPIELDSSMLEYRLPPASNTTILTANDAMRIALVLATLAVAAFPLPALGDTDVEIHDRLKEMHSRQHWGEIVLEGGRVRTILVDSLHADSAFVTEVLGPLHQRKTVYGLEEILELRGLGEHRIGMRRPLHLEQKSMFWGLTLELAIPGAGYFYAGDRKTGFGLLAVTGAAVATALATGRDGAAGWVPLSLWVKTASMIHLRDQMAAANRSAREAGVSSAAVKPSGDVRVPGLAVGILRTADAIQPALQVYYPF